MTKAKTARMPYGVTLSNGDKWTLIVDDTDFVFYKMELEKERGKLHHNGWPDEYPCLANPEFYSNDNGPDEWCHKFIYVPDVYKLWDLVKDAVPQAVANELMRDK